MEASKLILKNRLFVSVFVFAVLFSLVVIVKPSFIFERDGAFREFGVGNTTKTVVPMWLFVILMALLSYYVVNYFILYPKINF